jgi:hypothetical protein
MMDIIPENLRKDCEVIAELLNIKKYRVIVGVYAPAVIIPENFDGKVEIFRYYDKYLIVSKISHSVLESNRMGDFTLKI